MIRVDEIYNHTFWPWSRQNLTLTRLFFCDPPGRSDSDSLKNFGHDVFEKNYVFFHDQEPIHLDIHTPLFQDVVSRNQDLNHHKGATRTAVVTSERHSNDVDMICSLYDWKAYYYFFHGWAALDWYRGYHRTWLIPPPEHRSIQKAFILPNRIIGGKRDHRVLLLYHVFRQNIHNAWISCPDICPVEGVRLADIGCRYQSRYPDIAEVLTQAPVPLHFPGETDHPMHSCWLSLFDENASSACHIVTETVFFGRKNHITEKTFKPICLQMPFLLVSNAGALEYMRGYGFRTFGNLWDESYDDEQDDFRRLEKIAAIMQDLDNQTPRELGRIYQEAGAAVKHNYEHFYGGGFEKQLWCELTDMLRQIQEDFTC